MLAPIVVFAYDRMEHLKQTIHSLELCSLSEESVLFVFSDGPQNENKIEKVEQVRNFLHDYEKRSKFAHVTIVESTVNKGLAKNIIEGVTNIINEYGKVIVVEDDVTVAPYFLNYMNGALDYYYDKADVFSIGGLTLPMNHLDNYHYDVIKTQRVTSICWAIWKNRWDTINWDMPDYMKFRFHIERRRKFNRWGRDRSNMLDDQMNGRINSWAIRFDYYMWKNNQYNIIPKKTLANHEGYDGSGTHSNDANKVQGLNEKLNLALWDDCKDIEYCDVPCTEGIRLEYIKNYSANRIQNFKRFWGNILYSIRYKCF